MTAPSGDPGLDPTPTAPTPPAPGVPAPQPTPNPPGLDPNAPVDVASLPANVQKLIGDLRNEAAGHRQGKTEATQRLEAVLKAAGLNPDGSAAPPDPEQVAAQLRQHAAEADERAQAAEDARWGSEVKLQIHKLAGKCGADPDALLDSNDFVDGLDEIADDDPGTPAFREALVKKITAAVATNPSVRARRGAPSRMGADISGSGGGTNSRPSSLREAFSRKGT